MVQPDPRLSATSAEISGPICPVAHRCSRIVYASAGASWDLDAGLPAQLRAAHHPLHQKSVTHRLEFRRYRFPFGRAVRTAHGPWVEREGLLVRLEDEAGRSGYGEVAPIPWFGTETLEEAEEVLAKLGGAAETASLKGIDERYGCVRFALASALAGWSG